jgi:glutamate formiminotransferase/formiminotetrahydrofolate cyclodeaminase
MLAGGCPRQNHVPWSGESSAERARVCPRIPLPRGRVDRRRSTTIVMRRLIECVPNFSEGRDPARIRALVAAMSGIPGSRVLDCHSDADHHRTVITVAGEPEAVAEVALRAVCKATELIDLREHAGEHPRIGATDIVPFVPVEGVSMAECATLARRVGSEIWKRCGVPVYFYEAAATRSDRAQLQALRKGQFEGLRDELGHSTQRASERAPDIGGPRLHPSAGAVAVGARKYLIAFNVMLNTPDVAIAKKIARTVRASNGGLPGVKAMGVALRARGLAQVSMNLTDFERTSLRAAFEAVQREALKAGCAVAGSEIVGLAPRAAIDLGDPAALKLERFSPSMILENRIALALDDQATNCILAGSAAQPSPALP